MNFKGRLLGLDLGRKRVGVALSDETAAIASPHSTLRVSGNKELLDQVRQLIETHQVGAVVVGLPARLDGTDTGFSAKARSLTAYLAKNLPVPVHTYDERYTSKMAQSVIHETGQGLKRGKDDLDKVAAAIMLNDFIKRHADH
ncbi:MAG TPA: Holliday junction resolvase RuvX [Candidatus Edwardsbacteria bacterium]|nr:Holliday junction resolvase RuvX [Candidatus Edwardsbacteria bacterium]